MDAMNPFFELPNKNPLRCHVFSLDNVPCNTFYSVSPFAEKLRNVCWQLKSVGHEVYYYGYDVCEVECDEKIEVITEDILLESRPQAHKDRGYFNIKNELDRSDGSVHLERLWTVNAGYEFRKRYNPGDYCLWMLPGCGQRHLYAETCNLPVNHVEAGVGYNGAHLPYKVFESMFIRNFHYGIYHANDFHVNNFDDEAKKQLDNIHHYLYECTDQNKVYHLDAVIPNSFDISLFDFKIEKKGYLLYLARIFEGKGVKTAVEIAEKMKMKLIVAGPGDFEAETGKQKDFSQYVEVLGPVGPEKRRELLSDASAILCLTYPCETFGNVAIEAMLSGTVPITSNNGGFLENIQNGYNGFRVNCNDVDEAIKAVENIDKIDPHNLRKAGLRFSREQVALQYNSYLQYLDRQVKGNITDPSRSYYTRCWESSVIDGLDEIEWPTDWLRPIDNNAPKSIEDGDQTSEEKNDD